MNSRTKILIGSVAVLAAAIVLSVWLGGPEDEEERQRPPAAVQVAPVETRPLELKRSFNGALEANSKFVVAPKVSGRVEKLVVDLSDHVERRQTVALLDGAEFKQDVKQAEADLSVAEANLEQAKSSMEVIRRENERTATLRERGIASDAEFDLAQADLLSQEAEVKVANAQVSRAEAALEAARIRFNYTLVTADWPAGDSTRVVAERYVDEGVTVSANEALMLIVDVDPIVAVIFVTERDYGRLKPNQKAEFATDAFPGERFSGQIDRIAPVFRESSRQARVELSIPNPEGLLKPGMFVRATITIAELDDVLVVPAAALTTRGEVAGVFLVDESRERVSWQPLEVGLKTNEWVQVIEPGITGEVVVLGQHLLDDGARITIPESKLKLSDR